MIKGLERENSYEEGMKLYGKGIEIVVSSTVSSKIVDAEKTPCMIHEKQVEYSSSPQTESG